MWNGKMVDYYIKKYVEKDEYEPWQIESIRYSLLSIMLELEKWIVLICLFSILGMEYDFLIFAICLLCVRIYHGGVHMKTYTGCLIYSILYFFVAMGLHHMLLKADISIIVYIIIILSEMFVFIIPSPFKDEIPLKYFVPIMNNIDKENIKLDKKHNVIMKIKLLAVNVGLIAVSVYVKRNYILYIEITYIFHIMEFVIACIIKFSRGKNTKN